MISAIIITKNEEENIERCLQSVRWCDEIIVIDDRSTDKTSEIAKKIGAKVYVNPLNEDFAAQRNFGMSKAKNEWVLFVDSDEVVSDALVYEIQSAVGLKDQNLRNYNGFCIIRVDFMWGVKLEHGDSSIKLLRLGRKGSGIWRGKAHEVWEIESPIGTLINPLFHFPHKNLEEFLREINFYTDIRSRELNGKNVKSSFGKILAFPLGKFVINYFIKKGFLDGMAGLISAVTMSFHSFLVRGKLWQLQHKEDK